LLPGGEKSSAEREPFYRAARIFTVAFGRNGAIRPPRRITDEVRKHNLQLLKAHKVKLAWGSDRYGSTPTDDVFYLHKLGVFTNAEMLKVWCEATPQTIFPQRRPGKLAEGYEASFLTLPDNPLLDFAALKNVRLRVKQGVPLAFR
jgi:imidazolonepropionase-like amidohydrolase